MKYGINHAISHRLSIQYNDTSADAHKEKKMISQELLDILACPKCKEAVVLNDTKDGLICEKCSLLYEIRDDIPVMLIDEAKSLDTSK